MRRVSSVSPPKGIMLSTHRIIGVILALLFVTFLIINFPHKTFDLRSFNRFPTPNSEFREFVAVPMEEVMSGDPIEMSQDDPRIKKYIWDHGYLQKPSEKPYNLKEPNKNPSMGQGQFIQKIFKNMTGGFFIESGGLDGETRSNTLFLEKELGWRGIVIEADPRNYALILEKHRKAWTSNTCLATKPYPHRAIFQQHFNIGKIAQDSTKSLNNSIKKGHVTVQCFPIFSILNALSISTIDYFSLDIEGSEMELLANIPFDKIFIKTLSVEFSHVSAGKDGLKKFMEDKGYVVVGEVTHAKNLANDFMLVHHSLANLIENALVDAE